MRQMKLVQGTGAGFLVSCKPAEVEEMWLKRIAQSVADCCVAERTEAGMDTPVVLNEYCLMLKQFSWVTGSLRTALSIALCAGKVKGTLEHMEKSVYLLLQLLHISS